MKTNTILILLIIFSIHTTILAQKEKNIINSNSEQWFTFNTGYPTGFLIESMRKTHDVQYHSLFSYNFGAGIAFSKKHFLQQIELNYLFISTYSYYPEINFTSSFESPCIQLNYGLGKTNKHYFISAGPFVLYMIDALKYPWIRTNITYGIKVEFSQIIYKHFSAFINFNYTANFYIKYLIHPIDDKTRLMISIAGLKYLIRNQKSN